MISAELVLSQSIYSTKKKKSTPDLYLHASYASLVGAGGTLIILEYG